MMEITRIVIGQTLPFLSPTKRSACEEQKKSRADHPF